ncbi:MAG: hypothetical protein IPK67_01770 [Planctomycetes bacterium]|nr:hypothetical protein [Planctomycetota bacterium]
MIPDDFRAWIQSAGQLLLRNRGDRLRMHEVRGFWRFQRAGRVEAESEWTGPRPEYIDTTTRLIASFDGMSILCGNGLALQVIQTPGFTGLINLDAAEPDVSRRRAQKADVSEVLRKAAEGIRPQLVRHLDESVARGFVIEKLEFLDQSVACYGRAALRESTLPWISLLKRPGSLELVDSREFIARLSRSKALFVAFGMGPWTAMKKWGAADPPPQEDELAVVLNSTEYSRPPYVAGDKVVTGAFVELWPEFERAPLLGALMGFAAEGWQASSSVLGAQVGWQIHSGSVWGRIARP